MPFLSKRFLLLLPVALALPYCIYGWAWVIASGFGYHGAIRPFYDALGWDWAIFHTAARAWYDGNLAHIYDQVWLKQALDAAFAHGLKVPMPYPAFHYPPTFLLLLLPFGALGFAVSYMLVQVASFSGLVLALKRFAGQTQQFRFAAISLLVCPASSSNVVSGQNMFLVAALYVVGFGLLDAQPLLAGAVIGLASFKPQIALMVPFAFLGAHNWRALAGAAASALLLALVSVLVFGWGIWEQWFALMLHPRHDVAYTGLEWGRMYDDSVYTIAALLGASKTLAIVVQAIATLAAAASVFLAYRRPMANDLRFAVFLAASVVGSPHASPYDMILLAYAATILVWNLLQEEFRPSALVIPLAAWLLPFACPPKELVTGYAVPAVIFALIWALMSRAAKLTA
jgi:hypothetical protein